MKSLFFNLLSKCTEDKVSQGEVVWVKVKKRRSLKAFFFHLEFGFLYFSLSSFLTLFYGIAKQSLCLSADDFLLFRKSKL